MFSKKIGKTNPQPSATAAPELDTTAGPRLTTTEYNPNPHPQQREAWTLEAPILSPNVLEQNHAAASSVSSPTDGPTPGHLDALIDTAPAAPQAVVASGMISKEDFHKLFVAGFRIGNSFTGLQSLKVADDNAQARECAYAIHESIMDVPALHFMLQPGGKWFQRSLAIGLFSVPMYLSVKAELAARRRPAPAPQKPVAQPTYTDARGINVTNDAGDIDAAQRAALAGGR